MKTHWKQLTNPNYIGAYSLIDGKDMKVTIEKVIREQVTGDGGRKEECTVAYLKGQKPFIINKTNAKMISKIYGTPYIEDWVNKEITLYITTASLKGETVECLRIRPEKPTKEVLNEKHAKFASIKKTIEDKQYTVEQWRAKYDISKEVETILTK